MGVGRGARLMTRVRGQVLREHAGFAQRGQEGVLQPAAVRFVPAACMTRLPTSRSSAVVIGSPLSHPKRRTHLIDYPVAIRAQ